MGKLWADTGPQLPHGSLGGVPGAINGSFPAKSQPERVGIAGFAPNSPLMVVG